MNTRKMLKNTKNEGRGYGKGHVKSQYNNDFKNKCVHNKYRQATYIKNKIKMQEKMTLEKHNLIEKKDTLSNDFYLYLSLDEINNIINILDMYFG